MSRFSYKFILIGSVFCFLIALVNYYSDPGNFFKRRNIELNAAKILASGYNVTNLYNYDERCFLKFWCNLISVHPHTLILGSSRSMLIGKNFFVDSNIYNCAVSGASLEDFLAIYYLFINNSKVPKRIIFGLDPWILNENNGQTRFRSLNNEYISMLKMINIDTNYCVHLNNNKIKSFIELISKLFSPKYFQTSFRYIFLKDKDIHPTTAIINEKMTKLTDGTIYYDAKFIAESTTNKEELINNYITAKPIYSLGNFNEISNKNKIIFEAYIKYLKKNNVSIAFFLPPYPPTVYNYFIKDSAYSNVINSEIYYNDLANKFEIEIIGSYNPQLFNLTNSDFYDGMHCNLECIFKLFPSPL